MHEDVLELTTVDAIGTGPGACQPVLLHWGDLRKANQAADTELGARCLLVFFSMAILIDESWDFRPM